MLHIVGTAVIGMDYLRLGMHVSIELHPLILSADRSLIGDLISNYVSEPKNENSHSISRYSNYYVSLTFTSSSSRNTRMFVSLCDHDFSSINAFTRFISDSSRTLPASRTSRIKSVTIPGVYDPPVGKMR